MATTMPGRQGCLKNINHIQPQNKKLKMKPYKNQLFQSLTLGLSLLTGIASGQTLLYTNGGNWSGVDSSFTDTNVTLNGWGFGGQTDNCFWCPVSTNEINPILPDAVHCQVQLLQINNVFWDQAKHQPLQTNYGLKFQEELRFDYQNGYTTNAANEWDIDLLQFWQWATKWTNDQHQAEQWLNPQPEFMLWATHGSFGSQFQFKIYTNLVNSSTNYQGTELWYQSTTNLPVALEDGNWHQVAIYGSMSTNAAHSEVIAYIDGNEVIWNQLTITTYNAAGARTSQVVTNGPGGHITGVATLPAWADYRPRFGPYAWEKTGHDQFRTFVDNIVILSAAPQ